MRFFIMDGIEVHCTIHTSCYADWTISATLLAAKCRGDSEAAAEDKFDLGLVSRQNGIGYPRSKFVIIGRLHLRRSLRSTKETCRHRNYSHSRTPGTLYFHPHPSATQFYFRLHSSLQAELPIRVTTCPANLCFHAHHIACRIRTQLRCRSVKWQLTSLTGADAWLLLCVLYFNACRVVYTKCKY